MVNMTQPAAVTFPYLSQYGGVQKAAKQMIRAVKDAMAKTTGDKALDAALKMAEEEGIVSPQEVHQLMAQAQGRASLQAGDGTTVGNLTAGVNNSLTKLGMLWGKPFSLAEQFNRRSTFIAAYRTAVEQGMPDPDKFAEKAVNDTQFVMNKGNRPQWARGAIGSTLFTFKSYGINYLELIHHTYTHGGPEGKRAALMMLAMLMLMSGVDGLPFASDAEDLADALAQRLGYNWSSDMAKREFLAGVLGDAGAEFALKGVSGIPGAPIDVSGRLSMGNMIPGTGLLLKKQDHSRDMLELAGPMGDFGKRIFQGVGQLAGGDIGGIKTMAPVAGRNVARGADMIDTGMYRDDTGKKVTDASTLDGIFKAIGFQPNQVAREQSRNAQVQAMVATNKIRESEIADEWAKGVFERKPEKVQAAKDMLKRWNESNPDTKIQIDSQQIRKRVNNMRMSKAERITKSAPKAIRATVRNEMAGT